MSLGENLNKTGLWILHIDGSSNFKGSGLGLVLTSPNGDKLEQSIQCRFRAAINEAEYEALIAGVSLAKEMGIKCLHVNNNSQLIVNQMSVLTKLVI